MASFAYTEPTQLAALRAHIPTLGPNQELRNLARAIQDTFEGFSVRLAELSEANETFHANILGRVLTLEGTVTSIATEIVTLRTQHDGLQGPLTDRFRTVEQRTNMLEQVLSAIGGEVHDRVLGIESSAVTMAAGLSAARQHHFWDIVR